MPNVVGTCIYSVYIRKIYFFYTMPDTPYLMLGINIRCHIQKKYSKSPSVVHSIRASCENAAMFSCKKSNLTGRVPTSKEKKKIDINIFYLLYTPCHMVRA